MLHSAHTCWSSPCTVPSGLVIGAAIAIATMAACVDEPMAPAFDDVQRDSSPSHGRALGGINPEDLAQLERDAQLGHPSSAGEHLHGSGAWPRDDDMGRIATVRRLGDSAVPAKRSAAPPELADYRNAPTGIARKMDLNIPQVCHRDSPALDFERGWIFFDDACDALLAAKDQLRGTVDLNWDTATVMTEWDGVFLGNLGVERLYLHNRGLDGSIPPELGALDDLEVLSLGRNQLTGEIPPELGAMRDLRRLYLQDNRLTGEIPPEIGEMRFLERVYLWRNQLTGEIPTELGAMAWLERLNLGGNRLTGEIPRELGSGIGLVQLHLWGNELTGPIPKELGGLFYIEDLSLSRNNLSGDIPPGLADLRNLEALWLYENQLTGTIPTPKHGSWEGLRVLWLHDNQLSGQVPAELGNTDLYSLAISDNGGLAGPLPIELQSLLLDAFYWHGTDLCSPAEPSFQAWLASIDEDDYSGGPVCDSDSGNRSPVVSHMYPVTVKVGESVRLRASFSFSDPDGDLLTYTASSSDTSVATISISRIGGVATINGVAEGTSTIRITATDPGGLSATGTFVATVEAGGGSNRSPVTVGSIPSATVKAGESTSVNASSYFSDPDGDALTYTASSSRSSVATTSVSGRTVTVEGVAAGTATIRITATDPGGLSAAQTFSVTVEAGGGGDDYKVLSGLTITNSGAIRWNNVTNAGCIGGGRITISGTTYDVHWTEWQRKTGGSAWSQVSGTRKTRQICGYNLSNAAAGTYRFVGEFTPSGGTRAKYKSENEVTVGGGGGNQSPVTVGSIPSATVNAGESVSVNASSYFSDPDGDALTYTASSSRTSVATTSVSGRTVTVAGVAAGTTTIRITATDPGGLSAAQTFSVTVEAGGGGDDYKALSGLTIGEDGSIDLRSFGFRFVVGNAGCMLDGITNINGRRYGAHWSKWQRNTGSGWTDIAGTRVTGKMCGYNLTTASSGKYRLVGDWTIASVRDEYKSENEVTK